LDAIFELSKTGTQSQKDSVVSFIQEICLNLKNFPRDSRLDFLKTLQDHGIYTIIDSLDILSSLLENNPASVRRQILQDHSIMSSLLAKMDFTFHSDDLGTLTQLLEIFRLLLDPTGISATITNLPLPVDPDLDLFLEYFYSSCTGILFKPLEGGSDNLLTVLCELVSFIIIHHALFCKKYLGGTSILSQISKLLGHKRTFVRLAAVRVFKQTLATADEFYRRLLIKQDVFGRVFECLVDTHGKDNLLNSACLEFFNMILKVI
jgi:protein phosphatase 4 regulatory subunit 3